MDRASRKVGFVSEKLTRFAGGGSRHV